MRKLLVFLKYPEPGKVKTRLAAQIGIQLAADVYRRCVELTLERLAPLKRDMVLCVDPPGAMERIASWVGSDYAMRPQQGRDLGERLAEATGWAFAQGASHLVVIGTDSPWLSAGDIEEAFAVLSRADVAIGPAEDGGYYLIGLSRPAPALFRGIAWGTSVVGEQTAAAVRSLRLSCAVLKPGYDVDRVEDVARFQAGSQEEGAHA